MTSIPSPRYKFILFKNLHLQRPEKGEIIELMGSRRSFFKSLLGGGAGLGIGGFLGYSWFYQDKPSTNCTDIKHSSVPSNPYFSEERLRNAIHKFRNADIQNPLGPSPKAQKAFKKYENYWADYAFQWETRNILRFDLSKRHGVSFENIILRPGSTVILYDIVRSLGRKKGPVLISDPDYYILRDFFQWGDVDSHFVPVTPDFRVDLEGLKNRADKASFIYLSNPHNPYGGFYKKEDMKKFIKACAPTPVVVDEAYIQYVGEQYEELSCISLINELSNLVVTRTFSKIYGLAGLRLGYFASSGNLLDQIGSFEREVSPLSSIAGMGALQDNQFIKKSQKQTRKSQNEAKALLNEAGIENLSAHANFIPCRVPNLSDENIQVLRKKQLYFNKTQDGHAYHLVPTLLPKDLKRHLKKLKKSLKNL